MTRRQQNTLDYRRRLKHRLARQDEDAAYAALRAQAPVEVRLEPSPLYDQALAATKEMYESGKWVNHILPEPPPAGVLYGWPDTELHSVKVP